MESCPLDRAGPRGLTSKTNVAVSHWPLNTPNTRFSPDHVGLAIRDGHAQSMDSPGP